MEAEKGGESTANLSAQGSLQPHSDDPSLRESHRKSDDMHSLLESSCLKCISNSPNSMVVWCEHQRVIGLSNLKLLGFCSFYVYCMNFKSIAVKKPYKQTNRKNRQVLQGIAQHMDIAILCPCSIFTNTSYLCLDLSNSRLKFVLIIFP